MLLYTGVDLLGYQCYFRGILTDAELLDIINSCFQKSWGLLPCWIQENCHHLLPEQGGTQRVYYFLRARHSRLQFRAERGKGIRWRQPLSGELDHSLVLWSGRCGLQLDCLGKATGGNLNVSSTCIIPRAGNFSVTTSFPVCKGSNLNPQSRQAVNTAL